MTAAARVGLIATIALVLAATTPGEADAATRRATIYGDSLTVQAEPYLVRIAKRLHVDLTVKAYPGTAPCDYVPVLAADLASRPPDVAVLAFSGNSFVTCMLDGSGNPLTGPALLAKYRADVEAAVDAATRAERPIVLASPPISKGRETEWRLLDAFYRELAATRPGVRYLDAGTDIAPRGHFALTQRCLAVETTAPASSVTCRSTRSHITVRSRDGLHFCGPRLGPPPLVCPRYASGAMRYARNLVRGAARALDARRARS